MTPYSAFARYYDLLTSDVDYIGQADFLLRLWDRLGLRPGIVADLGCGTGSLLKSLGTLGKGKFDRIGVDQSEPMLSVAREKLGGPEQATLICQPMERLDLYGTIDAAVCFLDGFNHLTRPGQLAQALGRVSLFLSPGGVLAFDLIGPWQFAHTLRDNVFLYDYDDVYCVWHSRFHPKSGLCRHELTFFEHDGEVYRRSDEQFAERAYPRGQMERMLQAAGLRLLGVFDGYGLRPARTASKRLVFAARKEPQ